MTRHCLKYRGPATTVGWFVRMLEKEGVTVDQVLDEERLGPGETPDVLAHCMVCEGAEASFAAAVERLKLSPLGQLAVVQFCK